MARLAPTRQQQPALQPQPLKRSKLSGQASSPHEQAREAGAATQKARSRPCPRNQPLQTADRKKGQHGPAALPVTTATLCSDYGC